MRDCIRRVCFALRAENLFDTILQIGFLARKKMATHLLALALQYGFDVLFRIAEPFEIVCDKMSHGAMGTLNEHYTLMVGVLAHRLGHHPLTGFAAEGKV